MMQKIRYISNMIVIFFMYIKKWYYLLALYFFFSCIKQIFGYKKYSIIMYTFKNSIKLYFPNNHLTLLVISEIFLFEVFKRLRWCNCVLDIGWYVGESAVYLSKINKEIVVFEPDIEAFKILKKNIWLYHNIIGYNSFVTVAWEDLYIKKTEEIDCGAKWSNDKNWMKISSISIEQTLKRYDADAIKIDIEWWEFEILEHMIQNNLFTFKKWFIEFHFYENMHERKKFFTTFCSKLENLWYNYEIFDNYYNILSQKDIHKKKMFLCNMYFEKWKSA